MKRIGFSTGALAKGDVRRGVELLLAHGCDAIELSALREEELVPFLREVPSLPLDRFAHVSVHAPSRLVSMGEDEVCERLSELPAHWPVIVHPDIIRSFGPWIEFGRRICIENMDLRKPIGQTADDLIPLMNALPEAGFCLDLGHALQVDPDLNEARRLLDCFGQRLIQIHLSRLGEKSEHLPLNSNAASSFRSLSPEIPVDVPIIIEAVVPVSAIAAELELAKEVFGR